jgi:hypothetical protein
LRRRSPLTNGLERVKFWRALEHGGVDVESANVAGQLTFLDAEQTLGLFMRNGVADPGLFREHLGERIAASARAGVGV